MMRIMTATALALVLGCGAAMAADSTGTKDSKPRTILGQPIVGQGTMQCWSRISTRNAARVAFQRIDTDRDGKLSKAEVQLCEPANERGLQFVQMDGNGDGLLTLDEFADAAIENTQRLAPAKTAARADTTKKSDRTMNQTHKTSDTQTAMAVPPDRWYTSVSAADLIGREVHNLKGQSVGKVKDVLANTQSRHMSTVVEVRPVMGMTSKDVIIPLERLRVGKNNVLLLTQQDADQLAAMPAYVRADQYTRRIDGTRPLGDWNWDSVN